MASIELKDIVKEYSQKKNSSQRVLHGINASIEKGEFIVIIGPSGCGKSTLLRIVAGLEPLTGGQVIIGEKDVTQLEPSKRQIAMVFQNYALYPHMSVFDNMAYGVRLSGLPKDEIDRRIARVAKMLELDMLLTKKPRELSGGQRQRVAMGRAIVREPLLFLFDEPLSNLDAKLRTQTRLEIRKQHQELGITSLYVTHDQIEAMTLADRILVMNAGRIEQFDTPDEVYANPATVFVASFIGSPPMNMLYGKKSGSQFSFANSVIELPGLNDNHINKVEGELALGIRPEHLAYTDTPSNDAWQTELVMVETLGADVIFHLSIGEQSLIMRLPSEQAAFLPRNKGDKLWIKPKASYIHWFDAKTGKNINRLSDSQSEISEAV